MKRITTIPALIACIVALTANLLAVAQAQAVEFSLRPDQLGDLLAVWPALDGYEKAIDQGPLNPAKVIRINYTFSSDARKKLAANHRALLDAQRVFIEKINKLQSEVAEAISGPNAAYDSKNPAHKAEVEKRAKHDFDRIIVNLSPIAADDLKPGDREGENPIPDSVLTAFAILRTAPEKK